MANKEPMVWEAIVNDDARQAEIEARHRAERELQEKREEAQHKSKLVRMYEVAAKYVIMAMAFFTLSALAIEVNINWASWITGVCGVCALMATTYHLGKVKASK